MKKQTEAQMERTAKIDEVFRIPKKKQPVPHKMSREDFMARVRMERELKEESV